MPVPSLVLCLALMAQRPAADPFVAQRDAAAARNPLSPAFTIATEGNRRSFRIGERVPVVLVYDYVRNRSSLKNSSMRHYARVVLDRTDGTADPFADYDRAALYMPGGVCGCIEGGLPGAPKPPPVRLPVLLSDGVRFDRPGHYRLYIEDHHGREHVDTDFPAGRAEIYSNVIEIDITPRDEALDAAAVSAALRVLDTSRDHKARRDAAETLRITSSPRAIDEMARRFVHTPWGDEARTFEAGLFAVEDRSRAIAWLEREVADPAVSISMWHMRALAALRLTQAGADPLSHAGKRAALVAVETTRFEALKRAGRLVPTLTATFRRAAREPEELSLGIRWTIAATAAIAAFPDDVAAALQELPMRSRSAVVHELAESFVDTRFVPLLDGMARDGSAPALRVLLEVAPARAREIVLADFAARHPRLPLTVAGALPDETLPSLDRAFLAQLGAASGQAQFAGALERIARFASPAILPDVRAAYLARPDRSSCALAPPALSYLFRSRSEDAKATFATLRNGPHSRRGRCDPEWQTALLQMTADNGWSQGLEHFAVELLAGDDPDALAAAQALSSHGSEPTKAVLWQALSRWRQAPGSATSDDTELELMRAIANGRGWRFDHDDLVPLRAGCGLSECDDAVERVTTASGRLRDQDAEPEIRSWFDDRTGETRYSLDVPGLTWSELDRRLALYPARTSFVWGGDFHEWLNAWYIDAGAPFRRAQALVARHGMTLHRRAY